MAGNLEKKLLGKIEIEKKEYIRPGILNQFGEPIEVVPETFVKETKIVTHKSWFWGDKVKRIHYDRNENIFCFYPGVTSMYSSGSFGSYKLFEHLVNEFIKGRKEYHLQGDFLYKNSIDIGINIVFKKQREKNTGQTIPHEAFPEIGIELSDDEIKMTYTPDEEIGLFNIIMTKKYNENQPLYKIFNMSYGNVKLEAHFIGYVMEEKKKENEKPVVRKIDLRRFEE